MFPVCGEMWCRACSPELLGLSCRTVGPALLMCHPSHAHMTAQRWRILSFLWTEGSQTRSCFRGSWGPGAGGLESVKYLPVRAMSFVGLALTPKGQDTIQSLCGSGGCVYLCVCIYLSMCVSVCVCVFVCLYLHVYLCVSMYICVYWCICIYVCVSVCVYICV